jgi:hypothetical protein
MRGRTNPAPMGRGRHRQFFSMIEFDADRHHRLGDAGRYAGEDYGRAHQRVASTVCTR